PAGRRWYRPPPYGVLTAGALRACAALRGTVVGRLRGGGTVLLHDSDCTSAPGSWRRTLAALPTLLDDVRAYRLPIGTLTDHDVVASGRHDSCTLGTPGSPPRLWPPAFG